MSVFQIELRTIILPNESIYSRPEKRPLDCLEVNKVDTVENVFIENPAAGNWKIEVIATEVNEDGHLTTADAIDADYALVSVAA